MTPKAAPPTGLLEALQSFTGQVGGAAVDFIKGDLVEPSHPAAAKWPHLFGPVKVRHTAPVKVETASAAPGEKRG